MFLAAMATVAGVLVGGLYLLLRREQVPDKKAPAKDRYVERKMTEAGGAPSPILSTSAVGIFVLIALHSSCAKLVSRSLMET